MELSPGSQSQDKKPILTPEGLIQAPIPPTNISAKEQSSPTATTTSTATSNNNNLTSILPVIYEIIRCVEKDPLDNTAKQRESQECSQKILELQKRFEVARAEVEQLSGIDYNKEEQLQRLELLRSQLKLKQQLLRKFLLRYLANNEQLIQRMADSYPMRRAAQMVVSIMYRTKGVAQERGLHDMTPERFKSFIGLFKNNLKKEIEGVKDELKKKPF